MILVPIELLEERYSLQWYQQIIKDYEFKKVVGDTKLRKINSGEFLDVYDTNKYKLNQLIELITMAENGELDGETIVFLDGWFPGIQTLAYIRTTMNLDFKMTAVLHAGTWDKWDYLTQSGASTWGQPFEESFLWIYDRILVATEFHENLIRDANIYSEIFKKIEVVDFPVFTPKLETFKGEKENIVVFPHRLAPEKQPEKFDELEQLFREKYPDIKVEFIKSKDYCETKVDYYKLLAKSKVSVSFALQETFGIAMLESNNLGAAPLVPKRLSYEDIFNEDSFYSDYDDLIDKIYDNLVNYGGTHLYPTTDFKNWKL
jgi:glycosyltransferase involved in cell wall biosynthesis